jgi:hypothetical protein
MSSTPRYIIDNILHVFTAHNNLHIVLGGSTGQVEPDETEVSEPIVTIVLPTSSLGYMTEKIAEIAEFLKIEPASHLERSTETTVPENSNEHLGKAIHIKF